MLHRLITLTLLLAVSLVAQVGEWTIKQQEYVYDLQDKLIPMFAAGERIWIKARRHDGARMEGWNEFEYFGRHPGPHTRTIYLSTGRVPGEGTQVYTYDVVKAKSTTYAAAENILFTDLDGWRALNVSGCRNIPNLGKMVGYEKLKGLRVIHFASEDDRSFRDDYVWPEAGCIIVQWEVRWKNSKEFSRTGRELLVATVGNPDKFLFDTRGLTELDPVKAYIKNAVVAKRAKNLDALLARKDGECVRRMMENSALIEQYNKSGPASKPGAALKE